MAVEFICSECGGDATRCDCFKKRKGVKPWKSPKEELAEYKAKLLKQMEDFKNNKS